MFHLLVTFIALHSLPYARGGMMTACYTFDLSIRGIFRSYNTPAVNFLQLDHAACTRRSTSLSMVPSLYITNPRYLINDTKSQGLSIDDGDPYRGWFAHNMPVHCRGDYRRGNRPPMTSTCIYVIFWEILPSSSNDVIRYNVALIWICSEVHAYLSDAGVNVSAQNCLFNM